MKKLLEILAILVIIGFGVAYVQKNNPENVTPPTESSGAVVSETTTVDTASLPQNAKLINTDGILSFKQRCVLGAIDGGPLSYQLIITLMDTTRSTFNSIHFDINSKTQDELLNVGTHMVNTFGNSLQDGTYSWLITPSEIDMIIENATTQNRRFSAKGYIEIKKIVTRPCDKKMLINGNYVQQGNPEYDSVCSHNGDYLQPQKIPFACNINTY